VFAEHKMTVRFGLGALEGWGAGVAYLPGLENLGSVLSGTRVRISPPPPRAKSRGSHSSMDRVAVSGTVDAGSIPAGSTKNQKAI
jgi:hypothetical protein